MDVSVSGLKRGGIIKCNLVHVNSISLFLYKTCCGILLVQYFFGYKIFFSSHNNPKNLDPSYKMDLDICDCLGKVKLVL